MIRKIFISIFLLFSCIGCDEEEVDGNRPPVIGKIEVAHTIVSRINRFVINIEATDPDDDPLTITFESNSDIAILSTTSTALINIPPVIGGLTDIVVKVTADDGRGGIATREINIINDNKAPVIALYKSEKYKLRAGENTKLSALVGDEENNIFDTTFRISTGTSIGTLNILTNIESLPSARFTASQTNSGNVSVELEAVDTENNLKATSEFELDVGKKLRYLRSINVDQPANANDCNIAGICQAYAIDFDNNGNLFVTNTLKTVMKFDPSGIYLTSWNVDEPTDPSNPSNVWLRSIIIDKSVSNGNVYLASQNPLQANKILVYSQDGNFIQDIAFSGLAHYFLQQANGTLLISDNTDHQIVRMGTDGTIIEEIDLVGCSQPRQLSLDANTQNLYITCRGNNQIMILNLTSRATQLFSGNPPFNTPHGVIVDNTNNVVFVADTNNSLIQEFELDGTQRESYSFPGVNNPRYMKFGPDGNLYISSITDNKVHVFEYR